MPFGYQTFYHLKSELLVCYSRHGLNKIRTNPNLNIKAFSFQMFGIRTPHCTMGIQISYIGITEPIKYQTSPSLITKCLLFKWLSSNQMMMGLHLPDHIHLLGRFPDHIPFPGTQSAGAYTHLKRTHALSQNHICKPFLCPRIVYIIEGHSCHSNTGRVHFLDPQ